jgi:NYN domain-containing protein
MSSAGTGVLLIDWDNLAGAIIGRRKMITRSIVDNLLTLADRKFGGQLRSAHMAAGRFDGTIVAAMNASIIKAERVRSTKEQADILLTVLAMDYMYDGVSNFILVTGDQDFIPLITRLHSASCSVTVIYGDLGRLSAELRHVLETTPGLESKDIGDVTDLEDPPRDSGCRSLLGLLELQRRGFILGGREKGDRTALLARWGAIQNQDESQYWLLIQEMTEQVRRTNAAVRTGDDWLPRNATRTYLRLEDKQLADITAVDFAVRRLSARPQGLTVGGLRTGPFQTDGGAQLERVLDALSAVELVQRGADGAYSMIGEGMPLGYLEQVWRVYAGLSAECYRRKVTSIPYSQLESLLGRRGVGQGRDQRAASRIKEAIAYARCAGVIDAIAVDRKRHAVVTHSRLCRGFKLAYQELYREFFPYIDEQMAEADVIDFMERRDSTLAFPLFGFDKRDRHRILRVLSQSQLLRLGDEKITWLRSHWGDALIGKVDGE